MTRSWVWPDDIEAWVDKAAALVRCDRAYEHVRRLQDQLDDAIAELREATNQLTGKDADADEGTDPDRF